jgi:hypothetical protein
MNKGNLFVLGLLCVCLLLAASCSRVAPMTKTASPSAEPAVQLASGGSNTPQSVPHQTPTGDLSEFNITVGSILVPILADEAGRRTGRTSSTSTILQDIPGSAYGEDSISEDTNELTNAGSTGTSRQIEVSEPASGAYTLALTATESGYYTLAFYAYSSDGSPEPPIMRSGTVASGTEMHFLIEFRGAPGATSTLTAVQ